jgi:hypothetical protein
VLHFGRFFNKLIWSPCSRPTLTDVLLNLVLRNGAENRVAEFENVEKLLKNIAFTYLTLARQASQGLVLTAGVRR